MPRLFLFTGGDRYTPLGSSADRDTWLSHVYNNDMCVTQLNAMTRPGIPPSRKVLCTDCQPAPAPNPA
jgi:hypothetical protein